MRYDDARRNELVGLAASEQSSPYESPSVNMAGYSHAIIYATANTGAGETILLEIEDSADDTTFAATSCPSISIPENSGLLAKSFHIQAGSVRQYVRVKATIDGGATLHGLGAVRMNQNQSSTTAPDTEY
jgi:hypothetical protein